MRAIRFLDQLEGDPNPFFNISGATAPNFRAAWLAQSANVPIAFMGDSVIRGTDETASPYNTQFPNAGSVKLAALLNAAGINAGANSLFGCPALTIADLTTRDSRVSVTGATVAGAVVVGGGQSISMPGAGTLVFTPPGNVTKFDIWTYDDGATRTISWSVDGGGATNITTTGVAQAKKTTVSAGAAGVHALTLTWVTGSNHVLAIDAYDDTAGRKEISVWNWGLPGASTTSLVLNTNAPQGGRLQAFTNYAPKLTIAECGLVNSWRNSITVATSKANMLTQINTVRAAGSDFWFLTPPFDGGTTGLTGNQNAYVDSMYELAASEGVGLLDTRKITLSAANQTSLGITGDTIHPTIAVGHLAQAQLVYAGLRQVI
jgi:hypothetical protein